MGSSTTLQYLGVCSSGEKSYSHLYKDKNKVFVDFMPSDSPIDASSFKYLGNYWVADGMPWSMSYSKDKNAVYSCDRVLKDADVTTFTNLKNGYAKDKNNVWYLADVVSGVDVETFQSLGGGYAKDKNRAYFMKMAIDGVDVVTFFVVEDPGSTDEYGNRAYAKDKDHVYSFGKVLEGVDSENCTIESMVGCNPQY